MTSVHGSTFDCGMYMFARQEDNLRPPTKLLMVQQLANQGDTEQTTSGAADNGSALCDDKIVEQVLAP